jgi:ketose-bisphosphate aldolase
MALVTTKEMILDAQRRHYAVPAINTQGGNYDIIRAICFAADKLRSPVILAHYTATGKYSGDEWFVEVSKYLAKQVSVPVAIHLDHGDSFATCVRCLKYGFTSIMLDCSMESIADNIRHTNEVIKVCHAFGVPVEAEVGQLVRLDAAGTAAEHQNIAKVEEVRDFLAGCQPDMLAVGIGNAHGFYQGTPEIRLDLLEQVRKITDIPLVLHGCTGMPDETVKEAIRLGVAKINFGTLVRHKYVEYLKEAIDHLDHQGHSWKLSQYAEEKLEGIVADIIELSGSAQRY